ncbi:MAG: helix-turn-helix domain-containing protein [Treponema sp.]|jgi:transcriptional regulator with XRE-family HTH domain|nr:helix-turn-helix domain-containing protein [Treponema sp.]
MSFRENLRETIDFCGIEQKELAIKANISLRNIENYLRENASIPSADKAVRIAQVLGVTVEYLVTGMNSITKKSTAAEHEIRQLIRALSNLSINKQRIVIKNALYLIGIINEA